MKHRIEEALIEKNETKTELARVLGVTPQHINNWIARGSVPKDYIEPIQKYLNRHINWIVKGKKPKHLFDENTTPVSYRDKTFGRVPVISWVQAGETHVAFINDLNDSMDMVECHKSHGENSYALVINGSSMTASSGSKYTFPEGYIIIVDPDQKGDTTDGIFVIAKENGNDAVTFKQLKYDGTTPYLNPLNQDYPKIFKEFRILGKVIDVRPPELP